MHTLSVVSLCFIFGVGVASAAISLSACPSCVGLEYDGHGALSAGASSRLLFDYQEPYRSEILDYLFLKNFGASLHLIKIEIGGDGQSTDGTEPSHMHTRDDLNFHRGYEWWLVTEAKKRNPDVLTYALSWAVPHWVGNGSYFSDDNIHYHIKFLQGAKEVYGVSFDYVGIWNERSSGPPEWTVEFRKALDAAGFGSTRIVLPDIPGGLPSTLIQSLKTNSAFNASVDVLGVHYPCHNDQPVALATGHKYWASEDYSTVATWAGAGCWGRLLNQNLLYLNATSTIAWSLIWSVYNSLPYYGNGLMYANEPWSGHYSVQPPIWTCAHVTQFSQPGWRYLRTSPTAGGSGFLPGNGSYVTMVDIDSTSGKVRDFSVVVETLQGDCLRCKGGPTSAQSLRFVLDTVLLSAVRQRGGGLHLWSTNATHQFMQRNDIVVDKATGSFVVDIDADAMLTISTTTGQAKGSHPTPPLSRALPLPYHDSFDSYANQTLPKYFSAQGGSFDIHMYSASQGVLRQSVPAPPGPNQWVPSPPPMALFGEQTWTDTQCSVQAAVLGSSSTGGASCVGVCVRVNTTGWLPESRLIPPGYCLSADDANQWTLTAANVTLASGCLPRGAVSKAPELRAPNSPSQKWALKLVAYGHTVSVFANGACLGSVQDSRFARGQVAVFSGWHLADFDEFEVSLATSNRCDK